MRGVQRLSLHWRGGVNAGGRERARVSEQTRTARCARRVSRFSHLTRLSVMWPHTPFERCNRSRFRSTMMPVARQWAAANIMRTFMPAITSTIVTSSRMHGEFLRLLFLQAHRQTAAHFITIGIQ